MAEFGPGKPRKTGRALKRTTSRGGRGTNRMGEVEVREARLGVRVTRAELAALIAAAAEVKARDDREERALGALLRYLETQEERFEDVSEEP